VSYQTDHWNHFLSSIRNEPRGLVRVQNVSPVYAVYNCADKGFSTKHTLVNGLSVLICGAPRDTDKPQGCCRPVPSNGAVNVEGTGVTRAGKMIEHTGEVHSSNCPSVFGDASPISGASHKCLIPFISVACDTSVYPFGTIFEVSMLDKVEIAMPPLGMDKIKHPKYVVCEDTGSAIKGENRLDFYTGSYGLKSKANIFGSSASDLFKMFGNKSCHSNKRSEPLDIAIRNGKRPPA